MGRPGLQAASGQNKNKGAELDESHNFTGTLGSAGLVTGGAGSFCSFEDRWQEHWLPAQHSHCIPAPVAVRCMAQEQVGGSDRLSTFEAVHETDVRIREATHRRDITDLEARCRIAAIVR